MTRFFVVLHLHDDFDSTAPSALVAGKRGEHSQSFLIEEDVFYGRDQMGRPSREARPVLARALPRWWDRFSTPKSGYMPMGHAQVFRDLVRAQSQFELFTKADWSGGAGVQMLVEVYAFTEHAAARKAVTGNVKLVKANQFKAKQSSRL